MTHSRTHTIGLEPDVGAQVSLRPDPAGRVSMVEATSLKDSWVGVTLLDPFD